MNQTPDEVTEGVIHLNMGFNTADLFAQAIRDVFAEQGHEIIAVVEGKPEPEAENEIRL